MLEMIVQLMEGIVDRARQIMDVTKNGTTKYASAMNERNCIYNY